MNTKLEKVKLKGNESFNFREGWLRKGIRNIKENPNAFSQKDIMERLGVGSKMVKSIKYWLLTTGLCEEKIVTSGKVRSKAMQLTEDLGKIVDKYDPYFDDIFTLFVLHYHIVLNESNNAVVWYLFFNNFEAMEFTKDNMVEICKELLNKSLKGNTTFSESSFEDDCSSVLRMYSSNSKVLLPEESLECPLVELGLLKRNNASHSYVKCAPNQENLDKMAVLYVIVKSLEENKDSISIDELISGENNIGKVFNLSRSMINEYLDQLRISGYITINRTAGLNMIYTNRKNISAKDVLIEYYEKVQE